MSQDKKAEPRPSADGNGGPAPGSDGGVGTKTAPAPIETLEDLKLEQPSAETYAAIMAQHKPNMRGPGYIRLYAIAGSVFLCSTMSGFDSSLMSSINALPNFTEYFGLPQEGDANTGIIFAIFQIGLMSGAFFIWMADWYGRKKHMFFGCVGIAVGTIINALAINKAMFIAGRFVMAFFVTWATTAAPLYLVEIAPAAYRGTMAGLYNTFYYIGSILATSAVYACHKYLSHQGNDDWRIPLWLQMACPSIFAVVVLFLPESPRWLIANGRHEEAKAFFTTYHANGDEEHPLVTLQMAEALDSLRTDPTRASWKDLIDLRILFESKSSRYRIMLNMTWAWFGQFSGNNIISYYLPIMLLGIGIEDTNLKLILNIVYAIVGWIFASAGARLHDWVGRRKMFLGSTIGMIICLTIVAACAAGYEEYDNQVSPTVSIVFIFMFGAIFSAGYTPMQPVYPAEVVSTRMRAKAMGLYKITNGAASFLNTFVGPIALSSIAYWFYVFFVVWDTFQVIFMYFFFVETKGLTLEELDVIFEADNPRKESLAVKRRQRQVEQQQGDMTGLHA